MALYVYGRILSVREDMVGFMRFDVLRLTELPREPVWSTAIIEKLLLSRNLAWRVYIVRN